MAYLYNRELIDKGLSYGAYQQQIRETLAHPPQDESAVKMRPYLTGNAALMDKYDKSVQVADKLKAAIKDAPPTTWLIISEGWCGDAAFNVPVMAALEQLFPDKIRICIFLRDTNLPLMDANLTDGGRSIPKLVVLNKDLKESGNWGPRPAALQALMHEWKAQGMILKDIIPRVQEWYDTDNTASVQEELIAMIQGYSEE